jgi:hypothetical protein
MPSYIGEIWTGNYYRDRFTGWEFSGTVQVEAPDAQQAFRGITSEASKRFPNISIHLDRILNESGKIVYKTAWDELGPLVSVVLE